MNKTLGDIIRAAIRADGRTRYRLGKDTGIAQAVLGRFIRGERDITLGTATKLCRALGLRLVQGRGR